ncbi:MAG: hypothetical protein KDD32_07505 [Bacteroidetes bacterium]|nr:hypothetical protein [Bacteroidota bacterium]
MKILFQYIVIGVLSIGSIYAQEALEEVGTADVNERPKLTWEERKEIRKNADAEYLAWERKYFNSPGKWYMSFEGGYGFPFLTTEPELVPPLFFLGNSHLTINADGTSLNKLLLSGQGGGTRFGLSVGKMFNRFIGMEVKLGYFIAREDNLSTINKPKYYSELNTTLSEISISPQVVFQSPNMRNFYIVGKIGPFIPQWGNPRATAHIDDRDGTFLAGVIDDPFLGPLLEELLGSDLGGDLLGLLDFRTELDANVRILLQQNIDEFKFKEIIRAVGVNASIGFRYQPSPIVSVFGEVGVKGHNISLAKIIIEDLDARATILGGAVTLLELNENGGTAFGSPVPDGVLTSLLETAYVNELTEESNNPNYNGDDFSNFRPREELAPRLSVVSIGFNIGLQFNFPGKDVYYRANSRKAK